METRNEYDRVMLQKNPSPRVRNSTYYAMRGRVRATTRTELNWRQLERRFESAKWITGDEAGIAGSTFAVEWHAATRLGII